jgi:hypothetical protein
MKTFAGLVVAAALCAAAPASAAVFVMNLSGGGSNVGGSSAGNVRTYNATVGSSVYTLQASAWTNAVDLDPDILKKSYLGSYGGGLGVTSPGENGSNNTHTVDNVGRKDFILLTFNTAVDLTSMYLSVYNIGAGGPDSDATVFYRQNASAPVHDALSNPYFSQFTAINVPGNGTSGTRTVGSGPTFANTWLVSAAVDGGNDGFKLKSITLETAPVPEPSTWAMMILGFTGMGAALRARRRAVAAA